MKVSRRAFTVAFVLSLVFNGSAAHAGKFDAIRRMLTSLSKRSAPGTVQAGTRSSALNALEASAHGTTIVAGATGTAASLAVIAQVEEKGSGSVEEAAQFYYDLLNHDDRWAAMGMWLDPDPSHPAWKVVVNGNDSEYRLMNISSLVYGNVASTFVEVLARTNSGPWEHYRLRINWKRYETSWLIINQES